MHSPFLIGHKVYLRSHLPSDLDTNWYQWFNDFEVTEFMFKGVFPNTLEDQVTFFEQIKELQRSRKHLQLAVVHKETDTFIGVISLGSISWVNRSAEIALVIGEREFKGRGNGLEAMALLINHGFAKMNLNRIWAGQHVGLERWREALEVNLGFRQEGMMREAIFSHGRYHDVVIISVLAGDWFEMLKQRGPTVADLLQS
jgi:ribosomal-protein-alanine N-acetyltransferase